MKRDHQPFKEEKRSFREWVVDKLIFDDYIFLAPALILGVITITLAMLNN